MFNGRKFFPSFFYVAGFKCISRACLERRALHHFMLRTFYGAEIVYLKSHKSVRIQTPSAEYLYITEKRRACTAVILRKGYDRWKIFIVTAAVRCLNG